MLFPSCFLLCFCAHLFIDALWSPARKALTSWLSFVMSNCEVDTFPLASSFNSGAKLYRFLIFTLFYTLMQSYGSNLQRKGRFLCNHVVASLQYYGRFQRNHMAASL